MDLAAILKLLKENPEMLDTLLPVIKEVMIYAVDKLVDGVLEKV